MADIAINGTMLACRECGQGPPVLFVHGSASDHRTWQGLAPEFGKRFRVISYSRRFHWPNEQIRRNDDYAMSQQLDDLHEIIERLCDEPVHIVGHSYGALLALLLAQRQPSLIRTLVLVEPPAITLFVSSKPTPLELLRLLATRPRVAAAIIAFGARGIVPATAAAKREDMIEAMRIFGTAVLGRTAYQSLSSDRLDQVRANAIRSEFLGSGMLRLDPVRIRSIRTPSLLVEGQRSPPLFHALADALAELLPQTKRLEVERASHIVHEEDPQAFSTGLIAFLLGQGTAESARPRPAHERRRDRPLPPARRRVDRTDAADAARPGYPSDRPSIDNALPLVPERRSRRTDSMHCRSRCPRCPDPPEWPCHDAQPPRVPDPIPPASPRSCCTCSSLPRWPPTAAATRRAAASRLPARRLNSRAKEATPPTRRLHRPSR
ncbi:MAG: alpha/beta fold hydrolase [Lautropia sp.]